MPQLQAVGAVVHLLQGRHGGGVEFIGAVSLLGELPQLFGGEILQVQAHDVLSPLLVGHAGHLLQRTFRQLGDGHGQEQTAVTG